MEAGRPASITPVQENVLVALIFGLELNIVVLEKKWIYR